MGPSPYLFPRYLRTYVRRNALYARNLLKMRVFKKILLFINELIMLNANVNAAHEMKEKCFLCPREITGMNSANGRQRCNSNNFRR